MNKILNWLTILLMIITFPILVIVFGVVFWFITIADFIEESL